MGAEARGFIFGGALAYRFGAGFVPARKPGKLPWRHDIGRRTTSSTGRTRSRCTPTRSDLMTSC